MNPATWEQVNQFVNHAFDHVLAGENIAARLRHEVTYGYRPPDEFHRGNAQHNLGLRDLALKNAWEDGRNDLYPYQLLRDAFFVKCGANQAHITEPCVKERPGPNDYAGKQFNLICFMPQGRGQFNFHVLIYAAYGSREWNEVQILKEQRRQASTQGGRGGRRT